MSRDKSTIRHKNIEVIRRRAAGSAVACFHPSTFWPLVRTSNSRVLYNFVELCRSGAERLDWLLRDPGPKRLKTPKMKWRSPLKLPRALLGLTVVASLYVDVSANEGNWTEKHEAGRCAIRGQCGKKSFFGGELPCPNNGKAEAPDEDTRKKLVAICGDTWDDRDVCCDSAQVRSVQDQADFAGWTDCGTG